MRLKEIIHVQKDNDQTIKLPSKIMDFKLGDRGVYHWLDACPHERGEGGAMTFIKVVQ